jgi:type IV secretory pathway protease TraF
MQAAGVAKTAPRHEWPVAVLQQVVGGLMREAPRQLVARELWAGSGSAAGWWRRQQLFAASTAVMSMVTTMCPARMWFNVARRGWRP